MTLLVVLASIGMTYADDIGSKGLSAYKQRNYPLAEKYLTQALKSGSMSEDPKAAEQLFYLGLIYAKTERLDQARKAFEQVVQMVPETDALAKKARNNITYVTGAQMVAVNSSASASKVVRSTVSQGGQNNYLAHILLNGKVVRFDERKMPLKVYVTDGKKVPGWNASYKQVVTAACRNWQTATASRVRFVMTAKPDNADIVVHWQPYFEDNLLGVSPFQTAGDLIMRSDVDLALYYPNSKNPIPTSEMVAIATHEFGHAIGLKGHSPYGSDIMYFSRNGKQPDNLSARDVNTIKLLYKTSADVKNSSTMSTAQTQKYFDLFNQGVAAQQAGKSAQAIQLYRQAIQLAKTAPEAKYNLGILLINEGGKLANQKNLPQAAEYYREAEGLFQALLEMGNAPTVSKSKIPMDSVVKNLGIVRHNLEVVQAHR